MDIKRKLPDKENSSEDESHEFPQGVKLVMPNDEFSFQCSRCGECCRNVEHCIMLESLDVFRIARYFKQIGNPVQSIEEILEVCATVMPLTNYGYPIFLIKTTGPKKECVFLNSGNCSIQPAKPRTCRLYPLSAGPGVRDGSFDYFMVSQKQFHYRGRRIRVGDWMEDNFKPEDREFTSMEYRTAKELAWLLRKLEDKGVSIRRVLFPILFYKYYNFDVDAPFMPQYINNIENLIRVLRDLAET